MKAPAIIAPKAGSCPGRMLFIIEKPIGIVYEDSFCNIIEGQKKLLKLFINVKIPKVAIHGTHSSGSKNIKLVLLGIDFSGYAHTQNTTITEQLNIGVRFFDIRGSYDSTSQKIKIYHGNNDCYITVEEVVNEMKIFLKKYPSETILFSIKVEAGDDFATEFKTGIIDPNPNLFHLGGDTFPSLKTVRGKIVLMRRGGLSGIGNAIKLVVSDNTIGLNGNIKVQDLYNPQGFSTDAGISRKIAAITGFIPETKADAGKHNSAYLYINFTSQSIGDDQRFLFTQFSTGELRSISQIANIIHAKIIPKLTPNIRGIVASDSVGKSYTKAIIKNNFLSSSALYQELEAL